jgi:cytochrome c oxidase cbb3-type subunit 3
LSPGEACTIVSPVRASPFAPLLAVALAACAPDPGPVREWTPADHDQADSKANGAQVQQKAESAEDDTKSLVELAWRKNCATCHGPNGRGDGPQGPMVKAPDLTSAELLQKLSDDDIAGTIRGGKGRMPSFANLPDRVVTGLVQRIRAGGGGN